MPAVVPPAVAVKRIEWLKPAGIFGIAPASPIEYVPPAVVCGTILCESNVDHTSVLPFAGSVLTTGPVILQVGLTLAMVLSMAMSIGCWLKVTRGGSMARNECVHICVDEIERV